jgi:hypothetical protein
VWGPVDRVVVVKFAVPDPDRPPVATATPSTKKVTEPTGVAPDGGAAITVAVKVTACPKLLGFCELVMAVVVDAGVTVWMVVAVLGP